MEIPAFVAAISTELCERGISIYERGGEVKGLLTGNPKYLLFLLYLARLSTLWAALGPYREIPWNPSL